MICSKKTAILTLSLTTAWSVNALAFPQDNVPKPPPEAYTACEGKQPGEKAGFMTPQGQTISGTCEQQGDGRLFLKPDYLGRSSGNGIPPAAYQDCVGKRQGDAVQITTPNGRTISGTCQSDGDRLYLRPDAPPGMNAGMNTEMKPHNEGRHPYSEDREDAGSNENQYQEPRNGSRQDDTRQQTLNQNEDDSSYGNQQQSTPPEDMRDMKDMRNMHSNVQQYQESRKGSGQDDTRQQTLNQNEDDTSYGKQQQNPPPEAAYTVCEGKKAGDEIRLTTPQGLTITGTCEQDGDRLFLQPSRLGTPTDNNSSDNVQQHRTDPTNYADNSEEQPKGVMGKAKDFWKKLW